MDDVSQALQESTKGEVPKKGEKPPKSSHRKAYPLRCYGGRVVPGVKVIPGEISVCQGIQYIQKPTFVLSKKAAAASDKVMDEFLAASDKVRDELLDEWEKGSY